MKSYNSIEKLKFQNFQKIGQNRDFGQSLGPDRKKFIYASIRLLYTEIWVLIEKQSFVMMKSFENNQMFGTPRKWIKGQLWRVEWTF